MSNNNETGSGPTTDIDEVKRKQRAKKEPNNPIVQSDAYTPSEDDKITQDAPMTEEPQFDTSLPEQDGNKREQDVEGESYIEKDNYPFEQEQADKPKPKRTPKKTLPWETE
jgi:hypothetical protein